MKTFILIILILSGCGDPEIDNINNGNNTNNVNNTNTTNNTNNTTEPVCNGETFLPYEIIEDSTDCYGDESDNPVLCRQYCCENELTLVGRAIIRKNPELTESFYLEDVTNCGGCGVTCKDDAPYCRCVLTAGVFDRLPCMCTGVAPEDN